MKALIIATLATLAATVSHASEARFDLALVYEDMKDKAHLTGNDVAGWVAVNMTQSDCEALEARIHAASGFARCISKDERKGL